MSISDIHCAPNKHWWVIFLSFKTRYLFYFVCFIIIMWALGKRNLNEKYAIQCVCSKLNSHLQLRYIDNHNNNSPLFFLTSCNKTYPRQKNIIAPILLSVKLETSSHTVGRHIVSSVTPVAKPRIKLDDFKQQNTYK